LAEACFSFKHHVTLEKIFRIRENTSMLYLKIENIMDKRVVFFKLSDVADV